MRKIPTKLKEEMAADPAYKLCALRGGHICQGKIEWHHHIIFAGRQLNEKWAIVAICEYIHDQVTPICSNGLREGIPGELDRFVLNRATEPELLAVSKSIDYLRLRDRLNEQESNPTV